MLNSVLNSAPFFVHFFHVKPPSETSQLHVLWRKCRCAHSEFCCLCFSSLFSFFTAAHFHLAFVQILTASIKFSCCSSNEIRLLFISRSSVLSLFFSLSFTTLSPTFSFSLSFSFYIFQICGHNNFHVFPEKSTAGMICQIWVVTSHQCGISALVSQTSFGGKTSGSVAKCRLFSQAILDLVNVFGNVFAHHRKICANRHSAKIPMELYLRTFANK